MSLMAELGQGPAPPAGGFTAGAGSNTGARPQIHQHQSRVSYLLCYVSYRLNCIILKQLPALCIYVIYECWWW